MWPSPKKYEYSSTGGSKNAQKQATKLKRLIYFFYLDRRRDECLIIPEDQA